MNDTIVVIECCRRLSTVFPALAEFNPSLNIQIATFARLLTRPTAGPPASSLRIYHSPGGRWQIIPDGRLSAGISLRRLIIVFAHTVTCAIEI
jgi:hypothetical protein